MSTEKPSAYDLMGQYEQFFSNPRPCTAGYMNQCAVRMSVALGGCGFDLDGFPNQSRVHRGRAGDIAVPHVLGAQELADYLESVWGVTDSFRGRAVEDAWAALEGRAGVIYFNNCFRRSPGGPQTGDHIDMWSGWHYMNELLGIGAGGNAGSGADLFQRADAIRFFRLP